MITAKNYLSLNHGGSFVSVFAPNAGADLSRQLVGGMSLLLARLVAAAAVQGRQGVAKLEDLPQHVVGGEVEVDPGAKDLAEPLVLQHREPGVQPEHLPPELDLLAGRLPLLDPSQHISEAAPLFLPVFLAPRLVGVCRQLPHRNNQSLKIIWLVLRVVVVGKLENKGKTLSSCDAQVDVGGVEQASQGRDLGGGDPKDISRGEQCEQEGPGGEGGAVEGLKVSRGGRDGAVLLGVGGGEDALQHLHCAHHLRHLSSSKETEPSETRRRGCCFVGGQLNQKGLQLLVNLFTIWKLERKEHGQPGTGSNLSSSPFLHSPLNHIAESELLILKKVRRIAAEQACAESFNCLHPSSSGLLSPM